MMPAAVSDSQIDDFRSRLVGSSFGVVRLLSLGSKREFTPEGEVIRFTLKLTPPPSGSDTWPVHDINQILKAINEGALATEISEQFTVTFTNDE